MAKKKSELIEEIAESIRQQYYLLRAMHLRILNESQDLEDRSDSEKKAACWDGGQDSRGKEHQPVWPKLAKVSLDQGLDPIFWVSTLFSMTYMFNHVPRPSDLKNAEVVKRTSNWKTNRSLDLFYSTSTEWQNIRREQWTRQNSLAITPASIARTLIVDPRLEATALVRYAMAHLFHQADLATLLESSALLQYRSDREVYQRIFESEQLERLDALLKSLAESPVEEGNES